MVIVIGFLIAMFVLIIISGSKDTDKYDYYDEYERNKWKE